MKVRIKSDGQGKSMISILPEMTHWRYDKDSLLAPETVLKYLIAVGVCIRKWNTMWFVC